MTDYAIYALTEPFRPPGSEKVKKSADEKQALDIIFIYISSVTRGENRPGNFITSLTSLGREKEEGCHVPRA